MNHSSRWGWGGLLLAGALSLGALGGCSGAGEGSEREKVFGQMALPLTTQGASGVTYRLRDATFVIQPEFYYYTGSAGNGSGGNGSAGVGGNPGTVIVSSETDPDATNISVSLEEGYYYVNLTPGWHLEKVTSAGAEPVEATLLSGEYQWVYVSRQSSSFAEFSFGIGNRAVWLNGQLNIGIDVQETPGGSGGAGGFGGWGNTGGWSSGGWSGAASAGAPGTAGASAQ
jgi:hypothetical protein